MLRKVLQEIKITRSELKNIREEIEKQKIVNKKYKDLIERELQPTSKTSAFQPKKGNDAEFSMHPIGYIESCFKMKNGVPRQPSLCPQSKACLRISKTVFPNPKHSLSDLHEFSHVWIVFVFHKNTPLRSSKAKVHPPRLDGRAVGVFSTRSPHRPNPIGLSLTKVDKIEDDTIYLSGVDFVDGTPVLDIKPYVPAYDAPSVQELPTTVCSETQLHPTNRQSPVEDLPDDETAAREDIVRKKVAIAEWMTSPAIPRLSVAFTNRAEEDVQRFHHKDPAHTDCDFCLDFITSAAEARSLVVNLLQNDPRSVYRRNKCSDRLYYFLADNIHVTCWFDHQKQLAEVLKVQPLNHYIANEENM